ncbi:SPOR domain-containing protein [Ruegeria marisrubri]|nr:SPOR domain-containing protein [Ruegeria marisrubri]
MKRVTEKRTSLFRLALLALAMGALAACEEGAGSSLTQPGDQSAAQSPKPSSKAKQRDVEAPEVFEAKEAGLWDGRPSLGGIWVAHPDVTQPQRVKIVNTTNDKSTVGALFRRERALPGPKVQVSSDAAAKLGMLAGAPTQLHVIALRRETVEEPPKAKPAAAEKSEEPVEKPDQKKNETTEKPKEPTTTSTEPAAADQKSDKPTETANSENAQTNKKRKWWQKKPKDGEITETRLDPIAGAAAAIDAAETPSKSKAAAASSKPPEGRSITKPFVQIGTFKVEENAKVAAEKVRRGGLSAEVRSVSKNDKTVWRVVVGPAENRAERNEILAQVESLGFTDAYIVKD